MQVILLERVDKLGAPGSEVSVKRGYARNWLLPQGKAVLATEENRRRALKEQGNFVARDLAKKAEAEAVQQKIDRKEIILVRAAGESGQLYGSVRTQDIAEAIEQQLQIIISKKFVTLEEPIRSTGIFSVAVRLHPQVPVAISINVAPSEDEAKRQALKRDRARQKKESPQDDKKESRREKKSAKANEQENPDDPEATQHMKDETNQENKEENKEEEKVQETAKSNIQEETENEDGKTSKKEDEDRSEKKTTKRDED